MAEDNATPTEEGETPKEPALMPDEIAQVRALGPEPGAAPAPAAPAPECAAAPHPMRFLLVALAFGIVMLGMVVILYLRVTESQQRTMSQFQSSITRLESKLNQTAAERTSPVYVDASTVQDAGALTTSGNAETREGRYERALGLYKAAIAADRTGRYTEEAHYRCAQCLVRIGDVPGAVAEYRVVMGDYPGGRFYASATVEVSRLLMDRGEHAQARRLLYQLLGMKARLSGEDLLRVEQATFAVAACYEGEAAAVEQRRTASTASFGASPLQ